VKLPVAMIRFLLEAAFIILIAAATAVAHLGKVWIALSVGGAWLLVSVVERSAIREGSLLHREGLGFLFAGRQAQSEPAEPVADELPYEFFSKPEAEEHPPTPLPEPEPTPEPAPPAPEPSPPTPEPGAPPPPQLRRVPSPEPVPPPEPEPVREDLPEPIAYLRRDGGEPREWNIWELERLAREGESRDPGRDQELAFLLLELRQFANADGQLPVSFDAVVRESFGELLFTAV
jgi:hypothetical protein